MGRFGFIGQINGGIVNGILSATRHAHAIVLNLYLFGSRVDMEYDAKNSYRPYLPYRRKPGNGNEQKIKRENNTEIEGGKGEKGKEEGILLTASR